MKKINWKAIMCAVFGHPRVIDCCFGYETCARCNYQLGDSLGGIGIELKGYVITRHNCKICRKNWRKLKWHEKIGVGNPFKRD